MSSAALLPESIARGVAAMDRLFAGRRDRYLQLSRETGRGFWTDENLTPGVWAEHLAGGREIGIAPLIKAADRSMLRCAVVDIDRDSAPGEAEQLAVKFCQHATLALELEPWCERTKSGQVHVWLFFKDWVDAWKVRAILLHIFAFLGWKNNSGVKGSETTIYPLADTTDGKEIKGGVYAPLSGRFAAEERQVFFDWKNGAVYSDQLDVLEGIHPSDPELIEHHVKSLGLRPPNVHRLPGAGAPTATGKASAESLPPLSDEEFANLCAKLPSLRVLRDQPASASYRDWFAGILHLIPFGDARARAHELSALDPKRYNARACDKQYDAAVVMYADDARQPEPRVSQQIVTHWRGGGRTDITPISRQYCVWNGGYAKRIIKDGVEGEPMRLTNFTVQIISEESTDDGVGGVERRIRFRGTLAGGSPLREVSILAEEWSSMRVWLHREWGMRPVIYKDEGGKGGGASEVLRVISLAHQDADERTLFTHTGWCRAPGSGRPVFVLAQGPVAGAAEDIEALTERSDIKVHEKLAQYSVPNEVTDEQVMRAFDWVEALLECGPKKATAPLVAMHFLAPLYSWLRPNLSLWLAGRSGSLKSCLVAAAGALWGADWSYDHLPLGWCSSAKGILDMAFQAKDLPLVCDNFIPDKTGREQAKCVEVSHQLGDRQSRDKLSQNSKLMSAKPIRAMVISTGEDVPAGEGTANRWYMVPLYQGEVRSMALDEVQHAGWRGELAPAMTHYLRWLAGKLADPAFVKRVRDYFLKLEGEGRAAGAKHLRLPTQAAWVRVGLALCKAAHPRGAWKSSRMDLEIEHALSESAVERNALAAQSRLSYRFIAAIQYLIHTGHIRGVDSETGGTPVVEPAMFGWRRSSPRERNLNIECPSMVPVHGHSRTAMWVHSEGASWYVAIDPNEMITLIKETIRNASPIVESRQGIANNLISDNLLDRGYEKGHIGVKKKFAGMEGRHHVWFLHGPTYLEILGAAPETAEPPPATTESPVVRLDR